MKAFGLLLLAVGPCSSALAGMPALIPAPQEVEWTGGELDCSRYQFSAPVEAGFALTALEQMLCMAN
jgi:hypothetical protein